MFQKKKILFRMDQVYRAGSCSWYIRQKQSITELESGCKGEPCTSTEDFYNNPKKKSVEDDLSEYRLCGGGVSAKYLSNIIVIAAIQEITCGLIFATRDQNFYTNVQLLTLAVLRILQYAPCFMALLGNYRNNAYLSIPFMISQAIVGSYADIHTWILLCAEWKLQRPDCLLLASPLVFLVLPLLLYSVLLLLILYVQYKAVQFVSVKKLSLNRAGVADETLVESLM